MTWIKFRVAAGMAAVVFAFFVFTTDLAGQSWKDGITEVERVPVTIALVDKIAHPTAAAALERRTTIFPRDVIMLQGRAASADQLAAAVFTLLVVRDLFGDTPSEDVTIPVLRTSGPEAWRRHVMPQIGRLVGKLRQSEPTPIRGVGDVPAVTVWVPANFDARLTPAK